MKPGAGAVVPVEQQAARSFRAVGVLVLGQVALPVVLARARVWGGGGRARRRRRGSWPDEKYAVSDRDTYAQLNVNPNLLAILKNLFGVVALPSVMSFNAPRFSPSRPNVDRLRASA